MRIGSPADERLFRKCRSDDLGFLRTRWLTFRGAAGTQRLRARRRGFARTDDSCRDGPHWGPSCACRWRGLSRKRAGNGQPTLLRSDVLGSLG